MEGGFIKIKKLSPTQLSKLKNMRPVRVQQGVDSMLKVGSQNMKKLMKSNGKGVNLTLTPEEINENAEMSGGKLFKKIGRKFRTATKGAADVAKGATADAVDAGKRAKKIAQDPRKGLTNLAIDLATDKVIGSVAPKTGKQVKRQAKKTAQTGGSVTGNVLRQLGRTARTIGKKGPVRNALATALKTGVEVGLSGVENAIESVAPQLTPIVQAASENAKTRGKRAVDKNLAPRRGRKSTLGRDLLNTAKEAVSNVATNLSAFSLEQLDNEMRRRDAMRGNGITLGNRGTGVMLGSGANKMGTQGVIHGLHHSRLSQRVRNHLEQMYNV
jgi:hypothetical protein